MILKLLHLHSLVVLSSVVFEAHSQLLHRFLHCYYALCYVSPWPEFSAQLHPLWSLRSLLYFIADTLHHTFKLVIHHDDSFGCHMFHNSRRGVAGAYPIILAILGSKSGLVQRHLPKQTNTLSLSF